VLRFAIASAKTLVFGNHYYGLCAVALAIEAGVQQGRPLTGFLFYILLYLAVVLYYNQAYLFTETSPDSANLRSAWYARNGRRLKTIQFIYLCAFCALGLFFVLKNYEAIISLRFYEWVLAFIFPLSSAAYYGFSFSGHAIVLRNVGWLKPFIIGFSWAGLVTVYPLMYENIVTGMHYEPTVIGLLLFIKNLMFVAVLCIMFDVKDYAMDYNFQLKTFVVKLGLRKTIFYVIVPLCIAGLASFIAYALYRDFHPLRITFNIIPFIAVLVVAYSLHLRRSIFYYLVIIDGLMILKAVCGVIGFQFSNPEALLP
jgi:hypothetical protein